MDMLEVLLGHSKVDVSDAIARLWHAAFGHNERAHFCAEEKHLDILLSLLKRAFLKKRSTGEPVTRTILSDSTEASLIEGCIALLYRMDVLSAIRKKCVSILVVVCGTKEELTNRVIYEAVNSIRATTKENNVLPNILPENAMNLLCSIIPNKDFGNLAVTASCDLVKDIIMDCDERLAGFLLGPLLNTLCASFGKSDMGLLVTLLEMALAKCRQTFHERDARALHERQLMVICAVSTELFVSKIDSSAARSVMRNPQFWSVIQTGFLHEDTLTRKRSLYMVKLLIDVSKQAKATVNAAESVFWWTEQHEKELGHAWDTFILLIETLEQTQIHLVQPVMMMIRRQLIPCAIPSQNDKSLMHTSWITTVFERMAQHQGVSIRKQALEELLRLDLNEFPLLKQSGHGFLTGPFVRMMTEHAHYHRPAGIPLGECPPVAEALCGLLRNVCSAMTLEESVSFFGDFFAAINRCISNETAIFYLVRALSRIPPAPRLTKQYLSDLSQIMSPTKIRHTKIRGPVEQFLIEFIINNLDQNSVRPLDFASFLKKVSLSDTLRRGTTFWQKLCKCFAKNVHNFQNESWSQLSIMAELQKSIEDYMESKTGQGIDMDLITWVRLVCLLVDSGVLSINASSHDNEREVSLVTLLSPVLSTAISMGTHAYMTEEKAWRTVFALNSVIDGMTPFQESQNDKLYQDLKTFLSENLVISVLQFIVRYIDEATATASVQRIITAFTEFISLVDQLNPGLLFRCQELPKLATACSNIVASSKASSIQKYCSMSMLSSVCEILPDKASSQSQPINGGIIELMKTWKVVHRLEKGDTNLTEIADIWTSMSSQFVAAQWRCLVYYIQHGIRDHSFDAERCATDCIDSLDAASALTLVHVFDAIKLLMPKLGDDTVCSLVRLGWLKVNEEQHSRFWAIYNRYVTAILQTRILSAGSQTALYETLQQVIDDIFRMGEEKEGLINRIVTGLCQWWLQSSENMRYAVNYSDLVTRSVMFGPIHAKGRRFQNEVYQYLLEEGDNLAINQLVDLSNSDDSMVRVCILTFLAKLKTNIPQHNHMATSLVRELVLKQRELVLLNSYKQFTNSLSHRHKHRIFTALLILQPCFDEMHEEIFNFFLEVLLKENQASVRCQTELMLCTLVFKHQQYIQQVWTILEQGSERKPVYLCSIMTVMTRLGDLLSGETQIEFISGAIPKVLPWGTAMQFSLRTYAQGALLRFWRIAEAQKMERVLKAHATLVNFITFTQTNARAVKAINRLLSNFPFQIHPLEDLSIQTLVRTLPWLSVMTDEEWINPKLFEKAGWNEAECSLPLWNKREQLQQCKPGSWKVANFGKEDDAPDDETPNSDVQKKVIPWKGMLPEEELETDLHDTYAQQRSRANPLIVVASLIDKIPNLGGLCRTSEIFGVSEFVIGSIHYLKDNAFAGLSMTAHKWLPVREVKPKELRDYLVDMKAEGYTLVGAEQTANSVCLTEYTFPEKTLMLLGSEKEGIPVDLIQLLDVCVEIPQRGLIRSLNVHVSGALLVWEYTRQQMMKTVST